MRAELYLRTQEIEALNLHGSVVPIGKLGLIPRANLYRLLMNAPAAVCIVRGAEHVIELAFRQLTGGNEVLGQSARSALPIPALLEPLDGVLATAEGAVAKEVALPGDGEERIFTFVYQPMQEWTAPRRVWSSSVSTSPIR